MADRKIRFINGPRAHLRKRSFNFPSSMFSIKNCGRGPNWIRGFSACTFGGRRGLNSVACVFITGTAGNASN